MVCASACVWLYLRRLKSHSTSPSRPSGPPGIVFSSVLLASEASRQHLRTSTDARKHCGYPAAVFLQYGNWRDWQSNKPLAKGEPLPQVKFEVALCSVKFQRLADRRSLHVAGVPLAIRLRKPFK
jgi:hypothetical protein